MVVSAVAVLISVLGLATASDGVFGVFSEDYKRTTGPPVTVRRFVVRDHAGVFTLRVHNGGLRGQFGRVSSAVITLNGTEVIASSALSQNVELIERQVQLLATNVLTVDLRSNPGSGLTVEISRVDNTPPRITASVTPSPNAAGWHHSRVTVTFTCSDAGQLDGGGNGTSDDHDHPSGIASCPRPVYVTTDGANQVISGTAVDRAGNQATATVTVNLDKTPPVIQAVANPPPNAAGSQNTDVTVTFTCADATSGIASCPGPAHVTRDGANQVSGTAVDVAGNRATAAVVVKLDKRPPVIQAVAKPPPNTAGWRNTDVTVTFTCTDVAGKIASCPSATHVTTDGANQVISGTAVDRAGNQATATVTVNLDKTPPVIQAVANPPPNAAGSQNADVTVTFTCTDATSGIASCPGPAHVTRDGANQVSGTAVDRAGNRATVTVTVNIDRMLPAIQAVASPPPNAAGWRNADVTVTFTCTDGTGGIASCPSPVPVTTEGANQIISGTAVDRAGNQATATVTVNLDKTPPAIQAVASPPPNAAGWRNADVTVTFTCTDDTSGIGSCPSPVQVTTEGANQVISGTAVDRAGNQASTSIALNVDKTAPGVQISAPADGAKLATGQVRVTGTVMESNAVSVVTVQGIPTPLSGTTFSADVTLGEGPQTILVEAKDVAGNRGVGTVTVQIGSNRAPTANPGGPYSARVAQPIAFDATRSADPDDDPLSFAWAFGDGTTATGPAPSHAFTTAGTFTVSVTVSDGRGGTHTATTVAAISAVTLQAIKLSPTGLRLAQSGAEQALALTGLYADGTTKDLTAGSTGTTYESSNGFVAAVGADGELTAIANGATTITARHGGLETSSNVTVEIGVTLDTLTVAPSVGTLRAAGATRQLAVTGRFSDGSVRDLSGAATGTAYQTTDAAVAAVGANGLVTGLATGAVTITARNEDHQAEARISVAIAGGLGFVQGQVYDDTRGLPLLDATVSLLADGSGPLSGTSPVPVDDHGQFVLQGLAGEAIVRVEKVGFTSVERTAPMPAESAATLLDARLTPLDSTETPVPSAFGATARNAAGSASLEIGPGSLAAAATVRLTLVSGHGLQGRLPFGWSPAATIDIAPPDLAFGQPARLRVPNSLRLPSGGEVPVARYDTVEHRWVALESARVTDDGREIEALIAGSGQLAFLVPDSPPWSPPAPTPGEMLLGVAPPALPADLTATGAVVPRVAPPGDVRADGQIAVSSATLLPSGLAVQAHVTERYDLLDGSVVVPLPFTQDLVLYAQPAAGSTGGLGATFPITPSRAFTLQELAQGKVRLDIVAPGADIGGTVVGAAGGTVTDAASDTVQVPAGALAAGIPISIRPLRADEIGTTVPTGVALVSGVQLELAGAALTEPAILSIPRPASVPDGAQVIVAQTIIDPAGVRRLRIVAVGDVQASRIVSRTTLGAASLPGIARSGQYVFVRSATPLGFIAGIVRATDGTTAQALAVVTAETAPFADMTGAGGAYLVAGVAGALTRLTAALVSTGDSGDASVTVGAANEVVALHLVLRIVAPTVVATTPAAGASNVALNAPVVAQFSEPLDPATVTSTSVALQLGGVLVPGTRTISADRRTVTFRPDAELQPRSVYTVALTSALRDPAGHGLVPPSPVSFTTLDTAKPPQPPAGQITARLPDEDGLVMVFGTIGSAEPGSAVTATNPRTQGTVTVLAQADGSFRIRIVAALGDELALTFRTATGQEQSLAVTQFEDPDGTTGLGSPGGTVTGAGGRLARVLPRALAAPATFRLSEAANPSALPPLPGTLGYADRFDLTVTGGAFSRLRSMTLSERNNRFLPVIATSAPFGATGSLIVPPDFLVNGSLFFTATADETGGNRENAAGSTLVLSVNPASDVVETESDARFPRVLLTAPREATLNQQVKVSAIAPTARLDFDLPAAPELLPSGTLVLTRLSQVAGTAVLAVVDRMALTQDGDARRLLTAGRELPGATAAGTYAVVTAAEPLAMVSGRVTGPAATVRLDGTPFVFETTAANGAFVIPVAAGQAFSLSFLDPATGQVRGTATGQAPATGDLDLGEPLGPLGGVLRVSAQPDPTTVVDIAIPVVLTFSEPVDARSVTPASILVTDPGEAASSAGSTSPPTDYASRSPPAGAGAMAPRTATASRRASSRSRARASPSPSAASSRRSCPAWSAAPGWRGRATWRSPGRSAWSRRRPV